jgi:hypothetical protein
VHAVPLWRTSRGERRGANCSRAKTPIKGAISLRLTARTKKSAGAGLGQGLTPDASPSGFAAICPQKTHRFSPSNRFHSVDIFSDLLLIIFFL